MNVERKRTTVKPRSCPNPLFEKWLEEWRVEAANKNSDLQYCFGKALQSLRKYPIKLNNGKECLILKNFGTQLCMKLDRKLEEHRKNNPDRLKAFSSDIQADQTSSSSIDQNILKNRKKRRKEKLMQNLKTTDDTASPNTKKKKSTDQASLTSVEQDILKTTKNQRKDDVKQNLKNSDDNASPNTKKKILYVPAYRSGPYAILITLLKEVKRTDYSGYMLKKELQVKAQELCDVSFTKPEPGSYYTAWSSMTILIKKELITKRSNPAKFSLTKEGEELAKKLLADLEGTSSAANSKNCLTSLSNDGSFCFSSVGTSTSRFASPIKNNDASPFVSPVKRTYFSSNLAKKFEQGHTISTEDENIECVDLTDDDELENLVQCSTSSTISYDFLEKQTKANTKNVVENFSGSTRAPITSHADDFEQIIFVPGEFEIVLLVDIQETTGKTKNNTNDDTCRELTNLQVKFEIRRLNVGDFVWIARNHENKELLLPFIVERKRMDDLSGSIKDGRFHEQKFRLRQCGLQNVIYLIEKYGNETRLGLPINTLHQAIVNTQIVDNFMVKTTNNHVHSMIYLVALTKQLTNIFKDMTLISCSKNNLPRFNVNDDMTSLMTFQEFSKFSIKNKNYQIREMFIKHLLQLKGLSVEKAVSITNKYPTPSHLRDALELSDKPETLLANLTYGPSNRNVGLVISKVINQLYTNRKLN